MHRNNYQKRPNNMPPAKKNNIHSIRNNGDDDKDGGFNSWVLSIPIITRYWFVATLFFTLVVNFGYMPVQDVMWNWDKITNNFEVWRFVTPFVYSGRFSFNMLSTLYNLVVFSRLHELRWVEYNLKYNNVFRMLYHENANTSFPLHLIIVHTIQGQGQALPTTSLHYYLGRQLSCYRIHSLTVGWDLASQGIWLSLWYILGKIMVLKYI